MPRTSEHTPKANGAKANGVTAQAAPVPVTGDSTTGLDDVRHRARRAESTARAYAVFAVFAALLGMAALLGVVLDRDGSSTTAAAADATAGLDPEAAEQLAALAPAPSADAAEDIDFEAYERPDPALPAVPGGDVKRFRIDVFEHVTQVSSDLAPTRVWSYGVNGTFLRGTGGSPPLVVNEGDQVEIELVNGGSEEMDVRFPHSIDFHSSKVAPDVAFASIPPGDTHEFAFEAKHPGVFMYHCATPPVLQHTGAGMVGMMIVKPANLPPVDRELWLTQQEFYIGEPGGEGSLPKMEAKAPDVIAFNGFADQYAENPIDVRANERIRMYVLNAGPSIWSGFHVIGTVFDRTVVEGTVGRSAQTINLAPSQGGWVEFTLDEEGSYPFVTHGFGDMVKGAVGVLETPGAGSGEGGGGDADAH